MAANESGARARLSGVCKCLAYNARSNVIGEQRPDRSGPLLVIKRVFAGRDFAPSGDAIGASFDQYDVPFVGPPEAGFEKMNQRQTDMPQNNAIYFESHAPNRYRFFWMPITAKPERKCVSNCSPIAA